MFGFEMAKNRKEEEEKRKREMDILPQLPSVPEVGSSQNRMTSSLDTKLSQIEKNRIESESNNDKELGLSILNNEYGNQMYSAMDKYREKTPYLKTIDEINRDNLKGAAYGTERMAQGLLGFGEGLVDTIGGSGSWLMEYISSFGGKYPNKVSDWLGSGWDYAMSHNWAEDYGKNIDERYNPDDTRKTLGNIVQSGGSMLPSIMSGYGAASFASPTSPLLNTTGNLIAKNSSLLPQAMNAISNTGNSMQQAKDEGASDEEAIAYGGLSGVVNAGIESLFGGLPAFGEGTISKGIQKVVSNPIVNKSLDVIGEGLEESASTAVDPVLKRMTYEPDADLATKGELLQSGLMGSGMSLIMQGGTNGLSRLENGLSLDLPDARVNNKNDSSITTDNYNRSVLDEYDTSYISNPPKNTISAEMAHNDLNNSLDTGDITDIQEPARVTEPEQSLPDIQAPTAQATGKASVYQNRALNKTSRKIADILGTPGTRNERTIKPFLLDAVEEIKSTGTLSSRTKQNIIAKAMESSLVESSEFYDTYKDLREELKKTRIMLSPEDKSSIPDYNTFRKSQYTKMKLVNSDGIPVDVKYMELSERYPELFEPSITHPAEQVKRIAEVIAEIKKQETTLKDYYGDDAETFQKYAEEKLGFVFDDLVSDIKQVIKVENEKASKLETVNNYSYLNADEIDEIQKQRQALRQEADRIKNSLLLSDRDKVEVDRLLKNEITLDDISSNVNEKNVISAYLAEKPVYEIDRKLRENKKFIREKLFNEMSQLAENSNQWKDKRGGFQYSRETMERNFRDIIKNDEEAENVIDTLITPVHEHEADATRLKNRLREKVRSLDLDNKKKKYQVTFSEEGELPKTQSVSESGLVQLLGEKKITLDDVKSSGANTEKIQNAVTEFRKIYDWLFEQENKALVQNGYDPLEFRKDYFPHFAENRPETFLQHVGNLFGMDIRTDKLPTEIAGTTHERKPGKKWSRFFERRTGDKTDYDALLGFDLYIEDAGDTIFHTIDIQKLRAFENALRYKYSDEGIKEQITEIMNNLDLDDEVKQGQLDKLFSSDKSHLSNLVTQIRQYTDILAGKKSAGDRDAEYQIGRSIYNTVNNVSSRIASNMVAGNIGSALTNFIPITQAVATSNPKYLLKALWNTAKLKNSQEFVNESAFLTNRRGSQPLTKKRHNAVIDTWDSVMEKANLMEMVDRKVSYAVTKARYMENIDSGMSPKEAMTEANKWAAGLMADRSKGALPTIFNRKSPIAKAFLMFQTEMNNQLSYYFKDVPREIREKGASTIMIQLLSSFVLSYLYNEVYEKATGRRPSLDPIGMVKNFTEDLLDTDTEISDDFANFGKDISEQIPFIGGIIGGGRVPVMNVFESLGEIGNANTSDQIVEALTDPLWYLLPPGGGGQLKKLYEGISTVANGGSYRQDSEGNDRLQFAVTDPTVLDYIQAGLFGKWALPEGREYIENGFKSMSAKDTEKFKRAQEETDITAREFLDVYNAFKSFESTRDETSNEQKLEYLLENSELTESEKDWLSKELISNTKNYDFSNSDALEISKLPEETQKKFEKIQKNCKTIDANTFLKVYNQFRQYTTSEQKRLWLLHNKELSEEEKQAISEQFISDSKEYNYTNMDEYKLSKLSDSVQEKAQSVSQEVPANMFLEAYNAQKGIVSDKDENGKSVYLSSSRKKKQAIDEATPDATPSQRKALYEAFDISSKVW